MRSVPHRVVCLAGARRRRLPARRAVDGDDVLARRPLHRRARRALRGPPAPARRDRRDDRDAGDHLHRRGEHNGAERPPAVPLGELLDALDRTAAAPGAASTCVTARHPLQPFDAGNVVPGRLRGAAALLVRPVRAGRCAGRATGPRTAVRELVPTALPAASAGRRGCRSPTCSDFWGDPVQGFLRPRLRIDQALRADEDQPRTRSRSRSIPSRSGRSATGARRPLSSAGRCERRRAGEWRRGELPPGALGGRMLDSIIDQASGHWCSVRRACQGGPVRTLDVDIDLGGGRVVGTVGDVFGNNLVAGVLLQPRRQAPARVLAPRAGAGGWSARRRTGPPTPSATQAAPRGRSRCPARPLAEHGARAWLRDLVALCGAGLREPLPLPIKASLA